MLKPIICDLVGVQAHKGSFADQHVTMRFAEIAIDVIGHTLAEELLGELRQAMDDDRASLVVRYLRDAGLTFDRHIPEDGDAA